MLYLNAPARGREPNFLPTGSGGSEPKRCSVRPQIGLALVFDHKLWHEGATLLEGVKFAIRTDIMFSRRKEPERGDEQGAPAAMETGAGS